jgi:hypothetical protein
MRRNACGGDARATAGSTHLISSVDQAAADTNAVTLA